MKKLQSSIKFIKGVGPARYEQLKKLEIETVFDLLWHMPRGYVDREAVTPISDLRAGDQTSIKAKVMGTNIVRTRRGMSLFKALLQDDSGLITAVWFNQPFLKNSLKKGMNIYVSGKVSFMGNQLEINVAEYDFLDGEDSDKIVPI